ncbi:Uncharacterised protein [Shigella sonnei]|nr:Uncharacterised protein [Shigella sonnei]CSF43220.1 Uncharacterised protein [Shigella sonnei]CSG16629.1 Uncharacterised protein [Shigella sonnei]CSG17932.1 Uncharacterised protein [Shigella sonnei]CSH94938.1 Uncharacterised protein [Shigella sonnei]
MVRMMATTAQDPAQRTEHRCQPQHNADTRQDVFADASTGQAVG